MLLNDRLILLDDRVSRHAVRQPACVACHIDLRGVFLVPHGDVAQLDTALVRVRVKAATCMDDFIELAAMCNGVKRIFGSQRLAVTGTMLVDQPWLHDL